MASSYGFRQPCALHSLEIKQSLRFFRVNSIFKAQNSRPFQASMLAVFKHQKSSPKTVT